MNPAIFFQQLSCPKKVTLEVDLGVNWACPSAEPFLRVLQDERWPDRVGVGRCVLRHGKPSWDIKPWNENMNLYGT